MDIFDYLAHEFKDMSLFESTIVEDTERTGAIYNDFDNEEPFAHCSDDASSFSFSQTVDLDLDLEQCELKMTILCQYPSRMVDYAVAHIRSRRRISSDDEESGKEHDDQSDDDNDDESNDSNDEYDECGNESDDESEDNANTVSSPPARKRRRISETDQEISSASDSDRSVSLLVSCDTKSKADIEKFFPHIIWSNTMVISSDEEEKDSKKDVFAKENVFVAKRDVKEAIVIDSSSDESDK